jgi:hypothetical protein
MKMQVVRDDEAGGLGSGIGSCLQRWALRHCCGTRAASGTWDGRFDVEVKRHGNWQRGQHCSSPLFVTRRLPTAYSLGTSTAVYRNMSCWAVGSGCLLRDGRDECNGPNWSERAIHRLIGCSSAAPA